MISEKFHHILFFCLVHFTCFAVCTVNKFVILSDREAYSIACLGVADADWKALAHTALEHVDLTVANKAFARIKDLKYLELVKDFQVNL